MSDDKLVNIKQIAGKFKNVTEIKQYADTLFNKLQSAVIRIEEQNKEIAHLRSMLDSSVKSISLVPPEMLVCEMEIKRLQVLAANRELSFEEAKKFDIYTKNLLAIKRQMSEQQKEDSEHQLEAIDEKTLLQAISNADIKETSNQ